MKKILFFVFYCLLVLHVNAAFTINGNEYELRLIALPQSEINDIVQDNNGFIWLATLDGLYKYDGYSFKSFKSDGKVGSISTNMILNLDIDTNNNLWIGTYGRGISKYDYKNDEFINISIEELLGRSDFKGGDVTAMMVDSHNNIWIGLNYGLLVIKYDYDNDRIIQRNFFENKQVTNKDAIKDIYQDVNGNIWIAHNNYVELVLDIANGRFESRKLQLECSVIRGDSNSVFIGGNQLYKVDLKGGNINNLNVNKIYNNPVSTILKRLDEVWLGNRNGIKVLTENNYNSYKKVFEINKESKYLNINSDNVTCMLCDSENNIWVGVRGGGLYSLLRKKHKFNNFIPKGIDSKGVRTNIIKRCSQVRSIFEDSNGDLWIGEEEEGVFKLEKGKKYNELYEQISINRLYENRGYAFEETETNDRKIIWVGTSYPDNLVAIDSKTNKIINYRKPASLNLAFVFAIKKTDNKTLWVGTYTHGLFKLKLDDYGNIISYENFTIFNSQLSSNIIRTLYIDSKSRLWIGTDNGLNYLKLSDKKTNIIRLNTGDDKWLNNLYVLDIKEYKDHLLLGSMGDGLVVCDINNNKFRKITTENGLYNNSIKTILVSDDSAVWVSSNNGISKIQIDNNNVIHYGLGNGICEKEFSEICGVKRVNGDLIFGSRKGLLVFNPLDIVKNDRKPKVFISDMYINGNRISHKDYTKNLVLNYNDRNVSFEFTALQLSNPNGLKYYYKLEGFDNDWNITGCSYRYAKYTNLPEGNYKFIVRASNEDGVFSETDASLSFFIKPPFSRSLIAYIMYVILFILLLYISFFIVRAFYRKKKEVFKTNFEKKQLEELTQYKLQFFTDISHEFRTPLTLIEIPLETVINEYSADSKLNYYLTLIKQNVFTLNNLINQLLDFRKIERGKKQFNPYPIRVSQLVESIFKRFQLMATKQNIDYTIEITNPNPVSMIDLSMFDKVIVNLISNAFKYTSEGGKISVMIAESNKTVSVIVSDTGEGISEVELKHVFERFYQGHKQNVLKQPGTGIGLSLCKNIIDLHGGNIEISSIPHGGTKCVVTLNVVSEQPINLNDIPFYENFKKDTSLIIENELLSIELSNMKVYNVDYNEYDESRKKVLIVEDNQQLRTVIAENLKSDYSIVTASDGKEGLEKCIIEYPDVIVTDIRMPVMNGIDMCVAIKQNEEISHIPIVVLTANNSVKNRLDSYNLGNVDSYLEKPFEMFTLRSIIKSMLSNREKLQAQYSKNVIISPDSISSTKIDQKFVTKIIDIIKRDLSNPELSVELIAEEYGISRTYLNKKIKAITGDTTLKFIRNIRLKYAAQLLLQGEKNVSEVAWEVGYNDINTFRMRFKEVYGVVPSSYAKRKDSEIKD